MAGALLEVRDVTKRFGGFVALDGVNVEVRLGERLGLIGPNGSGKSTLVNCISGLLRNEGGSIRFDGTDIRGMPAHQRTRLGIARSFQIPKPFASMTVRENLSIPLEYAAKEWAHPGQVAADAGEILKQIGLENKADERANGLTQIELRKLELARAMAAKPK